VTNLPISSPSVQFNCAAKGRCSKAVFLAALLALFALSRCASADDVKALQGTWVPIKAELAGQAMPDVVLKSITLKIDKKEYEVTVTGEATDKGTVTLDTASKPKGMTVVGVKGPNEGKTFPAIYELKGGTLRVCYDLSGAKRPTEFKSTAGTKLYLVTYKRKGK
jgi:uncharacterized protein (TIGR03067 family)